MTITLQDDISLNQSMIVVDNPSETSLDDMLQIDDELVVVRARPRESGRLLVGRGALGTTRAAHVAGTPLVSPDSGVGFSWGWNFIPTPHVIAADGQFGSTSVDPPEITYDPRGFWNDDDYGAVCPDGLGGQYLVEIVAQITSPEATGYVQIGHGSGSSGPVAPIWSDSLTMFVWCHELVDLDDGSNTIDIQRVTNFSTHDVSLLSLTLTATRIGGSFS